MDKILILDGVDEKAAEILRAGGFHVDVKASPKPEELKSIISEYAAVIVRSNTKITADIIDRATNLKVIARAGAGVDNIDVPAATLKSIPVINADGNTISAAEHTIAMMMALSRNIAAADQSMKAGLWDKKRLTGVELNDKTLGIIGLGRVGRAVAERAIGLKMTVVAYDPFPPTKEAAEKMGVTLVDKIELIKEADFISIHAAKQKNQPIILGAEEFKHCKKGVRIVNCARDGFIDAEALRDALVKGTIAGAALDVFEGEPIEKGRGNPFELEIIKLPNVIATPHLGASTEDAQVRVAEMTAARVKKCLVDGTIEGAVNAPSLTAEERMTLGPHLHLASQLGNFVGQIMPEGRLQNIDIEYVGGVSKFLCKPVTAAAVEWLLKGQNIQATQISALEIAKDRGIAIKESVVGEDKDFQTLIRIRLETDKGVTQVAGTLSNKEPRIVGVDNMKLEAKIAAHMLFTRSNNKRGVLGTITTILGKSGLNIDDLHMGVTEDKTRNVSLITVDGEVTQPVLAKLVKAGKADIEDVRVLNMSGPMPVFTDLRL